MLGKLKITAILLMGALVLSSCGGGGGGGTTDTDNEIYTPSTPPTANYAYWICDDGRLQVAHVTQTRLILVRTRILDEGLPDIAVHPTLPVLYVVNFTEDEDNIFQFTVDSSNSGYPTDMSPATVDGGSLPEGIAIHPSGNYAYVVNYGDRNIIKYTIDSTGALSAPVSLKLNGYGSSIVIDSLGKYLYVPCSEGYICQFTIGADGSLTSMNPATVSSGATPCSAAISPSGKFLYALNYTGNDISQYTIGQTGLLSAMTPSVVSAGSHPRCIVIDPAGKYVYVVNSTDNTIGLYSIASSGQLSCIKTYATGAVSLVNFVIDSSGSYAYAVDCEGGCILCYTIDLNGRLHPTAEPSFNLKDALPSKMVLVKI